MMSESYKEKHVDFLTGLTGTSVREIQGVTSIPVLSLLLRNVILRRWSPKSAWGTFLIDFTVSVLPMLLSLTFLCDQWHWVALALITGALVISLRDLNSPRHFKQQDTRRSSLSFKLFLKATVPEPHIKHIVTSFRGIMLTTAAIAILAVDFQVFPRRFAKTETYGTGFMDGGVGAFTFVLGLISHEARFHDKDRTDNVRRLFVALRSCLPLLIFGFLRLLMVKSSGYQEHVTEYGVHWNFFFSLAAVQIFTSVLWLIFPANLSWCLALVSGLFYQFLLSSHSLAEIILHGFHGDDGRHSLIDANREGIFSCVGYFSIYFAGVYIGQFFFLHRRKTVSDWMWYVCKLAFIWVLLTMLLVSSEEWISPISRRLANLSFILWVISMALEILILCTVEYLIQVFIQTRKTPTQAQSSRSLDHLYTRTLCSAVNYNGLSYFVLSNLLTGLINKSIQTIYVSDLHSMVIIILYMFFLSIVHVVFYSRNIRFKF